MWVRLKTAGQYFYIACAKITFVCRVIICTQNRTFLLHFCEASLEIKYTYIMLASILFERKKVTFGLVEDVISVSFTANNPLQKKMSR